MPFALRVADVFPGGARGHKDPITGSDLVVGGGIAQLYDFVVEDGENYSAATGMRWTAEDYLAAGSVLI
jgi:hypothetical protein